MVEHKTVVEKYKKWHIVNTIVSYITCIMHFIILRKINLRIFTTVYYLYFILGSRMVFFVRIIHSSTM